MTSSLLPLINDLSRRFHFGTGMDVAPMLKQEFNDNTLTVDVTSSNTYTVTLHVYSLDSFEGFKIALSDYVGFTAIEYYDGDVELARRNEAFSAETKFGYCQIDLLGAYNSDGRLQFKPGTVPDLYNADLSSEQRIRALFKHLQETYRTPASRGCVKAFLGTSKLLWSSARRNNRDLIEVQGDFYLAPYYANAAKVFLDEQRTKWRWVDKYAVAGSDWIAIGGNRYDKSLVVAIYHRYDAATDQLGPVASYAFPSQAARMNRSYICLNGDVIYTVEPLPYAEYNGTAIWNYSKRIETLIPSDDLFRMGSVDLYKQRDQQEVPFLGWELEACVDSRVGRDDSATAMRDNLHGLVICKQDGSISPAGFETVSIPATLDFWKQTDLSDAMNRMRAAPFNMRSYQHSSCGFHVHVSRSALSVLDLQKIERFMHNPVNRDFLSKIAGRGSNTYAAYNDQLFNDRKSVANSYVEPTLNTLYGSERTLRDYRQSYSDPYTQMGQWFANTVSFGMIEQEYEDRVNHSPWNDSQIMRRGYSSQEMKEAALNRLLSACAKSNYCRDVVRIAVQGFFPGRDVSMFDVVDEKKGGHGWKAGVRKSKFVASRKHSYDTSRAIPGPLGKGAARYDVLNTSNKNTVEFRLFKGTMNPDSIYRYLEFVDALVRFVPTTSACNDGLDFTKFVEFIKNDSFNRLRYDSLLAFLIANDFVKRADIRRRNIKEVKEVDNDLTGVVVKEKEGPVTYLRSEEPPVVEEDDYEDDYEEDYEPDENCDCDDCRSLRGED